MRRFLVLTILFCGCQWCTTFAQEIISIGSILKLHSVVLQEDREVLVSLPNGYDENPGMKYPVIYLLDGSTHFRYTSGIVKFLSETGKIPPMIVVGILNTDRMRDFTTPLNGSVSDASDNSHSFPSNGGAALFSTFLEKELKPYIDGNFRTDNYDVIAGHSISGLFVIDCMLKRPGMFDGYIAVSSSLWWNNEEHLGLATDYFKNAGVLNGTLYLSYGGLDGTRVAPACINFVKLLKKQARDIGRWKSECHPDEGHGSTPLLSVYRGLEYIFEEWQATPSTRANEGYFKY